jgi:hypothetical protein
MRQEIENLAINRHMADLVPSKTRNAAGSSAGDRSAAFNRTEALKVDMTG